MATAYPSVPGVRFKDVSGRSGYCVGDDSSVWSCRPWSKIGHKDGWRQLTRFPRGRMRYLTVYFYRGNGRTDAVPIHHIVLTEFVGPRPPGMIACHFPDPDVTNNRLENLRWDTYKANAAHSTMHGTRKVGSRHPSSKLTENDIPNIRKLRNEGCKLKVLSEMYGVSLHQIAAIAKRRNWKHVV